MSISIQTEDFCLQQEYEKLRSSQSGAIVTFCGLVRDHGDLNHVSALHLEHYPGMTEKALSKLLCEAMSRWPLNAVRVIHRYGTLKCDEQIVFVGVASGHRAAAFSAASFIMDRLKSDIPFWKKEVTIDGEQWVKAKTTDQQAAERW